MMWLLIGGIGIGMAIVVLFWLWFELSGQWGPRR